MKAMFYDILVAFFKYVPMTKACKSEEIIIEKLRASTTFLTKKLMLSVYMVSDINDQE